jgi:hypothetical protein
MTTTIRRAHRCELPPVLQDHGDRDVIRCDTCGRYWQAWCAPGFEVHARWEPISRIAGWLLGHRANRKAKKS